jgi:hypothetical protein
LSREVEGDAAHEVNESLKTWVTNQLLNTTSPVINVGVTKRLLSIPTAYRYRYVVGLILAPSAKIKSGRKCL